MLHPRLCITLVLVCIIFLIKTCEAKYLNSIAPIYMNDPYGIFTYYKGNHPDGRARRYKHRQKARPAENDELIVDLLYVVDYSVYDRFVQQADGQNGLALKQLAQYFNVIAFEVDRIAHEQIRPAGFRLLVNPVGLYVAKSWSDSPWVHTERVQPEQSGTGNGSASRVQIVSVDSLESFRQWTLDNARTLPKHDHAVAVTRLELINPDGSKSVEGVAWPESICSQQGFSISIVEDFALTRTVWSVVHELMHSLGADHGNHRGTRKCVFEDFGYLNRYGTPAPRSLWQQAADGNDVDYDDATDDQQQAATYKMAKCAVKMVAMHIRKSRPFTACLHETTVDWVGSLRHRYRPKHMPGQTLDADSQCQLMLGPDYVFCKHNLDTPPLAVCFLSAKPAPTLCTAFEHKKWYAHYLCQRLFCVHKDDITNRSVECSSVWTQVPALYATSCGDRQWCHDGECVDDQRAPDKHDVCHRARRERRFCSATVRRYPWACDVREIRQHCCKKCDHLRNRRNRKFDEHYRIVEDLEEIY